MVRWTLARGLLAALLVLSSVPLSLGLSASFGDFSAHAQGVIQNIRVEGSKRVEPETVRSYLTFSTGDAYDPAQIDESLKALFATGLFQDVRIRREGATIVIVVVENPIVSQVAFEGNREVEDDTLAAEVQLKPRAVYTRARVQADVQRILDRLSPPRPLRRAGRSQDHQSRQQPHRRRVRDQRGPGHQGPRHQLHRQRGFQRLAAPLRDLHHADQPS